MNILFIGDVIGSLGRKVTEAVLPTIRRELAIDFVIVNGENSAHGYSITEKIYTTFIDEMGIDAITMGNHTWEKKEMVAKIDALDKIARPANYPPGVPGKDYIVVNAINGVKVGIINLLGRVFMQCVDCPFQAIDKILPKIKQEADIIIVDVHAEATSEKTALGIYLDGKVSAVLGTHTHVMTADEKIMPGGTAYISDVGMVGGYDSIIGMKKEQILKRFITQLPEKFEPQDEGPGIFNAVLLKIDDKSGKALQIERISRITEPAIFLNE